MSNRNNSDIRDYSRFTDVSIENGNLRTINQHLQDRIETLEKAICDALCIDTVNDIHDRLREAVRQ